MQGVDIFDMSPLDSSRKGIWNSFVVFVLKWQDMNICLGAEGIEDNFNVYGWNHVGTQCILKKRLEFESVRGQGLKRSWNSLLLMIIIGTLDNPIMVKSFGDEQYAGCTGYPVDSHVVIWLTVCPPSLFRLSWSFKLPLPPIN